MTLVVVTIAAIGIVMVAMAIGVLVKGKCLSGSCGGPKVTGTDGELVCGTCGRHEKKDLTNVT
jgi:hypothetical protein